MTRGHRVHVFIEERFIRSPDGKIWSANAFGNALWEQYLQVFDEVVVVARIGEGRPSPRSEIVDLDRVRFKPIPYYHGPRSFVRVAIPAVRAIREATTGTGAFILRLPGPIGAVAGYRLISAGKPFAVDLVGDPDSLFASGVGGGLAPLYRIAFVRATRHICLKASAVSYVTANFLQQKYPGADPARSWHCPSVSITDLSSERSPARDDQRGESMSLFTAGSLEQRYKGVDILLRSLHHLQGRGPRFKLRVAGEGQFRQELEQLSRSLGLSDSVTFLGWISRDQVIAEMESADMFVLASRTEGLPRVIIEAMSRGLPVVGTRVGGVPELLSEDCIVPPDDVEALAGAISRLARDPVARAAESQRNVKKAEEYRDGVLRARRRSFFEAVSASVVD